LQVERRKALQEHAKASVVVEWKEKQLKAAKKIIGWLCFVCSVICRQY